MAVVCAVLSAAPDTPSATLTVSQQKLDGPAVLTLTLEGDTDDVLVGPPTAVTDRGSVRVVPKSLTRRTCQLAWDLAAARRASPVLGGAELRIVWRYGPETADDLLFRARLCVTSAYLSVTPAGAVSVGEVRTGAAEGAHPFAAAETRAGTHHDTRATAEVSVIALRPVGAPATRITLNLKGGRRLVQRPITRTSMGRIAAEQPWHPKAVNTFASILWTPPDRAPGKRTTGELVWTWTDHAPRTGEERIGRAALRFTVSPAGNIRMTSLRADCTVTRPPRPADDEEDE